jgi:hypothetical protein
MTDSTSPQVLNWSIYPVFVIPSGQIWDCDLIVGCYNGSETILRTKHAVQSQQPLQLWFNKWVVVRGRRRRSTRASVTDLVEVKRSN